MAYQPRPWAPGWSLGLRSTANDVALLFAVEATGPPPLAWGRAPMEGAVDMGSRGQLVVLVPRAGWSPERG